MTNDPHAKAEAAPKRHRATKREMTKRDLRLIERLAAGVTIEEIAASEGITVQWARERKAAILAKRVLDPPHDFVQLQIRRLSEAMLVAYSAMSNGNLHAVDHVVKIVRELDRYHGFGAEPNAARVAAPVRAERLLALPEPLVRLPAPESEPAIAGS
jgi:hypothetical protein